IEPAELALEKVASDLQASLALLLLDELPDLRLRTRRLDEAQPVLVRSHVCVGEDLDRVAVLQLVAQRHHLPVYLRARAVRSHFRVDRVREVDGTAPLRKAADV